MVAARNDTARSNVAQGDLGVAGDDGATRDAARRASRPLIAPVRRPLAPGPRQAELVMETSEVYLYVARWRIAMSWGTGHNVAALE